MHSAETDECFEPTAHEEAVRIADPRRMTRAQLRRLGLPRLVYLRCGTVDGQTAFAVHAADGTTIAVVEDLDVAMELAFGEQHDIRRGALMPLIATSIEAPGVARIFFDMRAVASSPDEEQLIAAAIERAFCTRGIGRRSSAPRPRQVSALPRRGRLEQFHHVARGILAQDLPSAWSRRRYRCGTPRPARAASPPDQRDRSPAAQSGSSRPAPAVLPSGIGFAADARGPASHSVRSSRATIAIAGPNCWRSAKPRRV